MEALPQQTVLFSYLSRNFYLGTFPTLELCFELIITVVSVFCNELLYNHAESIKVPRQRPNARQYLMRHLIEPKSNIAGLPACKRSSSSAISKEFCSGWRTMTPSDKTRSCGTLMSHSNWGNHLNHASATAEHNFVVYLTTEQFPVSNHASSTQSSYPSKYNPWPMLFNFREQIGACEFNMASFTS